MLTIRACGIPHVSGRIITARRTGKGPAAFTAGSTPNGPAATAKYAIKPNVKKLMDRWRWLRGDDDDLQEGRTSCSARSNEDTGDDFLQDRPGLLSADDGGSSNIVSPSCCFMTTRSAAVASQSLYLMGSPLGACRNRHF